MLKVCYLRPALAWCMESVPQWSSWSDVVKVTCVPAGPVVALCVALVAALCVALVHTALVVCVGPRRSARAKNQPAAKWPCQTQAV